jgi:hypothetical protein
MAAVSCWSAGNCSADGDYTDRAGHAQMFVASQVNGTWGTAEEVPGRPAGTPRGETLGSWSASISCSSCCHFIGPSA